MGIPRWWMLGAVLPLVAGCGGGSSSDDDRERFGLIAGFGTGSSPSTIIEDVVTASRFELATWCFEEESDDEGGTQASDNELESDDKVVQLVMAHVWINNVLDTQRVEVDGAGFEVTVFKEEDGAVDIEIWNSYQSVWFPIVGRDKSSADVIRENESLSDQEKLDEIAALPDLVCYQEEQTSLDSAAMYTIDIPQSERLPPQNALDWSTPPESANTAGFLFRGWSEDGSIEAVAGEYYAIFKFDIHLPGESAPAEIRRDFTIID